MRRRAGSLLRRALLCAVGLVGAFSHGAGASPRAAEHSAKIAAAAAKPRARARALDGPEAPDLRAIACAEAALVDPEVGSTCAPEGMRFDATLALPTGAELDDHPLPNALHPVAELAIDLTPVPALATRYLKFFANTAQGRAIARRWLRRVSRDGESVRLSLARAGLPLSYVAIPLATSGLASDATWKGGAAGAWGLGAAEGRALGLEVEPTYDERRDVARASDSATRRLHSLRMRYGSWPLVVAALDVGEAALDAACSTVVGAHGCEGVELAQIAPGVLPRVTIRRIARIAALATLLENLQAFGFEDVRDVRVRSTATLEVPAGTSLRTLARAAGSSVIELRALNPAVIGELVGDQGGAHAVRVPSRGLARATALLPRLVAGEGDGAEMIVAEDFDWGRPDVSLAPPNKQAAKPSKGAGALAPSIAAASPSPVAIAEPAPRTAYSKVRAWPSEGDVAAFRVPRSRPLAEIALQLRVPAQRLAALNGMALDAMPAAGSWLRVPTALAQADATRRRRSDLGR